jgi:hypothetical protein
MEVINGDSVGPEDSNGHADECAIVTLTSNYPLHPPGPNSRFPFAAPIVPSTSGHYIPYTSLSVIARN